MTKPINLKNNSIRFFTLLLSASLLWSTFSCTDSTATKPEEPPKELIGEWKHHDSIWDKNTNSSTMIFYPDKPKQTIQDHWGFRLKFNADNTCESSYSAKCGNDGNIHGYNGRYTYYPNTKKVIGTIPFMNRSSEFTLISATKDSLVIVMAEK
jgi:hypothetical protein